MENYNLAGNSGVIALCIVIVLASLGIENIYLITGLSFISNVFIFASFPQYFNLRVYGLELFIFLIIAGIFSVIYLNSIIL